MLNFVACEYRNLHLDILDALRFALAILLKHMFGRYAKAAQPMQDWVFEAALAAEVWIKVQWVVVSIQSVQSSLIRRCLLCDHSIWCSLGWLVSCCGCWVARSRLSSSKATRSSHKCCNFIGCIQLVAVRVYNACSGDDQCGFAFVLDVYKSWLDHKLAIDWQWGMYFHKLFTMQEHPLQPARQLCSS